MFGDGFADQGNELIYRQAFSGFSHESAFMSEFDFRAV